MPQPRARAGCQWGLRENHLWASVGNRDVAVLTTRTVITRAIHAKGTSERARLLGGCAVRLHASAVGARWPMAMTRANGGVASGTRTAIAKAAAPAPAHGSGTRTAIAEAAARGRSGE